ncbi:MAG: NDP-sugar synthase [Myxococcaceae bacterium]
MRAMILCAGLGTRLRPLTTRWPKPAVPFLGQPLFRYNLAVLKAAGVTAVGINTHHLPEEMRRVAEAECERAGMSLTVSHEPVIQGTGGGIRGLRRFLEEGDFIVFNGDILYAVDLAPIVKGHRSSGAAATMVLLPMPEGEKYAAVELDPQGHVRRIAGHGPGGESLTPWHFTGVHVMTPAVFDFMAREGEEDINRVVYPRMIHQGLIVRGHVGPGWWSDVGTPGRYLAAQRDVLSGRVDLDAFPGASPFESARRDGPAWRAPGARIEPGVVLEGPSFVDRDAHIEPGARIGSCVYVGPGVRVPAGVDLNQSAVLEDTELSPGEALVDAIAWQGHRIRAS